MLHTAAHRTERLATVDRLHERDVVVVDDVRVLRVGVDLRVVPRALAEIAVRVDQLPRVAAVVRAKDAAGIGLDVRPEPVGVRAGHGDADVSPEPFRQAGIAGDLRPVVAAVGRFEHPAAGAARRQHPGRAPRLPEAGVEHVRIVRVHREVADAR